MNSENSKTSDHHRLLLNLSGKLNLKKSDKYISIYLSNLSIYYTSKNIKKLHKNNKFKISSPTLNEKFELPKRLYSVSYVQDYFKYIIKKHKKETYNPPKRVYVNQIENRITFRIKAK